MQYITKVLITKPEQLRYLTIIIIISAPEYLSDIDSHETS